MWLGFWELYSYNHCLLVWSVDVRGGPWDSCNWWEGLESRTILSCVPREQMKAISCLFLFPFSMQDIKTKCLETLFYSWMSHHKKLTIRRSIDRSLIELSSLCRSIARIGQRDHIPSGWSIVPQFDSNECVCICGSILHLRRWKTRLGWLSWAVECGRDEEQSARG